MYPPAPTKEPTTEQVIQDLQESESKPSLPSPETLQKQRQNKIITTYAKYGELTILHKQKSQEIQNIKAALVELESTIIELSKESK